MKDAALAHFWPVSLRLRGHGEHGEAEQRLAFARTRHEHAQRHNDVSALLIIQRSSTTSELSVRCRVTWRQLIAVE